MRRTLTSAVLGVVTAALLSSCMGGAAGGGAAADGPPVRGGNLNVAVPTDPQSLDMVANPGQVTAHLGNMLYEKLFEVDRTFTARPMLVQDYTTSPDRLTYEFKLRQGVTFHDGAPLTANDVVASLQRWQTGHRTGQLVSPDIEAITAPDPATVTIRLKRPRYPLINELAGAGTEIYEAKNLAGVPPTGFGQDKAIGTGPYKLKSWDIGRELVLERHPGYASRSEEDWGGQAGAKHAYLDTVTYKVVSDQDALINGLQTGQWDHAMPTNDQYETLRANPAVVVHNLPGGNENVVIPNFNPGSRFADPRARQALNLLLDKPALNAATGGSKDLTLETGAFASPDNQAFYSTAGEEVYRQRDPEKARQLLAEAGITAGATVRIVTTNSYPEFGKWAVLIQDELSKIGITTKIDTFDFATMLGTLTKDPGGWDLTTLFFDSALTSPAQMPALTLGTLNGSSSPELDALMAEYNASTSPEQAKAVVDKMQAFTWQQLSVITLSQSKLYAAYSPRLKGYGDFYRVFWNSWLAS
ncbi:ABC transporter substrate-binding protein [Amycolatopsis magusensis]|uniref:Peptide/nickel transport system substrate-binding protein n=1 Tax=Amycolatopsis magusensis TaxID=882444 RepID=A0ABS4PUK7_9PSEU|nr:ABC transporter substrate-binding protein [Amycolatopsis magusensis]MBP2182529.1 peptide/nickel transport system substrate-binding protein [Amycolatopsis magusensis]MDI5981205.1 ABC transporter substrate-binding protein [Amycolatopsis magusensis]